jgi:hypothetical protein
VLLVNVKRYQKLPAPFLGYTVPPMATRKPTHTKRPGPPKGSGGRPTKSAGTATAEQVSVRLIPADLDILRAIQAQEQARMDELGVPMQVSPADAVRIILRAEGKRRGLVGASAEE